MNRLLFADNPTWLRDHARVAVEVSNRKPQEPHEAK
jgi:hypothetical protein